jgi:hypothetical protein
MQEAIKSSRMILLRFCIQASAFEHPAFVGPQENKKWISNLHQIYFPENPHANWVLVKSEQRSPDSNDTFPIRNRGKYPPADPGALNCEPLKAAKRGR